MNPPLDLFAAAAGNDQALDAAFAALQASLPADRAEALSDFSAMVEEQGKISINLRQTDLIDFLAVGRHETVYEWAAWMAGHNPAQPVDVFVEARLRRYHPARMAFDAAIVDGRQLRYGALNVGGTGPGYYGEFALILHRGFPSDPTRPAYLPDNSLLAYVKADLEVDLDGLARDAAPHSHRHLLAALKHAEQIAFLGPDRWPAMLCSDRTFIEALFVLKPTPGDVSSIRIKRTDHDLYFDYLFDALAYGSAEETQHRLAEGFATVLRLVARHQIDMEVIDDAEAAGISP